MRIYSFIVILSLLVAGFTSAANAFGLLPACDPAKMAALHMMDCCNHDHGQPVHPNCLKCDCCMAAVPMPALASLIAVAAAPFGPLLNVRTDAFVETALIYQQLRPPNPVA